MMKSLSKILCGTILSIVTMGIAFAQDETELAKKTQNPVADLISVPLQSNFNFGTGYCPTEQTQYPRHLG